MIALARQRAADEQLPNATFRQVDAQVHPFSPESVDLALSRHGAMFFGDPVAAFTNIARALRPDGQLVLLTWQPFERNEFIRAILSALTVEGEVPVPPSDAPSPLALGDPDRVRSVLGVSGFTNVELEEAPHPGHRVRACVARPLRRRARRSAGSGPPPRPAAATRHAGPPPPRPRSR